VKACRKLQAGRGYALGHSVCRPSAVVHPSTGRQLPALSKGRQLSTSLSQNLWNSGGFEKRRASGLEPADGLFGRSTRQRQPTPGSLPDLGGSVTYVAQGARRRQQNVVPVRQFVEKVLCTGGEERVDERLTPRPAVPAALIKRRRACRVVRPQQREDCYLRPR
jgi:hypothetical protein